MKFKASFTGKVRGAIGLRQHYTTEIEGESEAAARLALYDRYEDIHTLILVPLSEVGPDDSAEWLRVTQSEGRLYRPGRNIPLVNLNLSDLEHRLASQLVERPSVGINIHTTDTGRTPTDLAYLDRAQEQIKALRNHPFLLKRRVKAGVATLGNVTTAIANASGAIHRMAETLHNSNREDDAQALWDEVVSLNAAVEELDKLKELFKHE